MSEPVRHTDECRRWNEQFDVRHNYVCQCAPPPSEVAAPTIVHCYNCSRNPKPNEPLQWEYRPNKGLICDVCLEDEIMGGEKGV